MSWSASNATLTVRREDNPRDRVAVDLTTLRNQRRAEARANGEDLVALDIVPAPQGEILQTVWKRPSGLGFTYRGRIEFSAGHHAFCVESEADEGRHTGTREAMVNAARVNQGEFALGPRNEDGSYSVQGLLIDAYDPAFDQGALNSLSDDERLDALLPGHPLSRVRETLATILRTLDVEGSTPAYAPATADEATMGPRRELSLPVLRGLFSAAGRFDLVEHSFREELATVGDTPTLRLATLLMQLGVFQQMRDRPGNAAPILARAESLFVQLKGDEAPETVMARAHHGIALFKLGDHRGAGPLVLRAVEQFEQARVDEGTQLLALATAAQLLAHRGDEQRATRYLQRSQELMARMKSGDR
jgi:hypothetical protein